MMFMKTCSFYTRNSKNNLFIFNYNCMNLIKYGHLIGYQDDIQCCSVLSTEQTEYLQDTSISLIWDIFLGPAANLHWLKASQCKAMYFFVLFGQCLGDTFETFE